jgi:hypothetical protein
LNADLQIADRFSLKDEMQAVELSAAAVFAEGVLS